MRSTNAATQVALTDIPDSWRWMKPDLAIRLLPMVAAFAFVEIVWRPSWLGLSLGRIDAQLIVGAVTAPVLFVASTWVQLLLTWRRGAIGVPSVPGDAWFQAGVYPVNGPVEDAFCPGVLQGCLGVL